MKQTAAIDFLEDDHTIETLFGGAAGGGKSILGCYWLTKNSLRYDESRWVMGRADMKTLKETTYQTFLKVAKMQNLKAGLHFSVTSPQHKEYPNCILFPNKSVILMKDLKFYPSDPEYDDLGSLEITGAFVDEGNQITSKCKGVLRSRMRHNNNRYGIPPKLLITCNPAKNYVYYDFYKPFKENKLPEYRQFIQSLVYDNPDIDPYYIENLKQLEKKSRARLLDGDWEYDDDPTVLIEYEKIIDLFTNNFDSLYGEKFITADIARQGSDKITIGLWNGYVVDIYSFQKQYLNETGAFIENLRLKNNVPKSNVLCDEDGVGGGIVDFMGYKGFVNNSSALPNPETGEDENYFNLKSQCYFLLAKRINNAGMYVRSISDDDKPLLIEDLEHVKQYNMDKDGKLRVLPKEKIKEIIGRSPDFSDLLMIREWFNLEKKLLYAVI